MSSLQQSQPSTGPVRTVAARTDRTRPSDDADDPEARLSQQLAAFVESGASVGGFLLHHPRRAIGVLTDIRSLPRLDADLPPGPESAAVAQQMMRNPTSRRFLSGMSAVLWIPREPGTYLEGHERATVRRKVRSATKRGVTARAVPAAERSGLLALANQHEQQNERTEYRTDSPENDDLLSYDLWIATYDDRSEPLTLAVIPVAGRFATLRYFRTLRAGDASSDARYLMSQAVAEALCERHVHWLVDTARPHWLPNGLRHFQRMVGFRLARVGPARVTG